MEYSMPVSKTIILRDPWEAEPRILELGMNLKGCLEVRDIARHEASNATPFHAANASGTYAYHGGTWSLRDRFVGKEWTVDRVNGVEVIRNEKLKIVVAFSNVDLACNDDHIPQPITKKGSGAERTVGGLFSEGDLPRYAVGSTDQWKFYYLMVDENGAAELTRTYVKGGRFVSPIERIYLSEGSDDDGSKLLETPPSDMEFDPKIARK